ncbi:MAG: endolytic transglycosylase MltG [Treponema sp.]|nr:endolytic transglycosylase MltG [Treponema sp.]
MKSKNTAKAIFGIAIVLAAAVLGGFFCVKSSLSALDAPAFEKTFRLKIEKGASAKKIAELLAKEKIIKNDKIFYLLARFPKIAAALTSESPEIFCVKSGVCDLKSSMDAAALYKELSAGREELTKVSIPEGLTISKIAVRLDKAGICRAQDFVKAAAGMEGFLFPDTYSLAPDSPAEKVVKIMADNFYEKIKDFAPLLKIASDKKELQKTVTLASIIEREYRSPDEAPLIASVFTNRIKKGIGLYSCATVEYVVTELLGRPHPDIITYDDLKIQSPYNTYINAGLPPAPICNPGLVALKAAAEPAQTDFYYFQLMDEAAGRHVFTKTLSEHVQQGAIFKTKKASR